MEPVLFCLHALGSSGRSFDPLAGELEGSAEVRADRPPDRDALAVQDLLRTSGEAWAAWLREGSREDWSDRLGTLVTPTVIVSGGEDGDLGSDAQRRLNGPIYPRARFVTLPGAGHLLPLERPREVAAEVLGLLEPGHESLAG